MEKEKLTQNELVIAQLMDGDALTSKDIADKATSNGVSMDVREVSTIMNKLCKTDLGHFISRKRHGRSFEYQMVDEAAKNLTLSEAYGLSLKIGKNRYPLEQALEDHPDLKKHVKVTRKKEAASGKAGTRAPAVDRKSKSSADTGESVKMDAEGLQSALMGLLKMMAGDGKFNVNVDVTVRIE